ncbi:hypothetical protein EMIHUDRAFT_439044 [Emiliania huxleyi CCMP1516]|uniref:NADP-dependent oxidoreductase domain-containing protein n=2 Tax=Emiliania huxleyi TaxID=2903 RepID=A0A0D3I155_EMIH1|nr:hypothetical protein EMIHUDRAFT_439044 [Emiliania huxleyi CCMP1516]EOD04990.1 hypothetical protein EMIHUDRAFT_439044 [Emiliania huxleyi CCMP1516]|eukprot:XP_005757419.1 hypothetical protein EMIHUDRAFT_439044 [Emiliania huxleyi CCMP1516]
MINPLSLVAAAVAVVVGIRCAILGCKRPASSSSVEIAPGVRMPLVLNGMSTDHGLWLASGGRGIDTAFLYGDELQRHVASGIAASGVEREEVFVTIKVNCCPTDRCSRFCAHPPRPTSAPPMSVYNGSEMLEHSLAMTGQRYVDLALLHFPCSSWDDTLAMYRDLEAARDRGLARAIGVSNFNASALKRLLRHARTKPAVVQNALSVAGHPAPHRGEGTACSEGAPLYGSDDATLRFARRHRITFAAYSPLGSISRVDVLGHPVVREVAAAHGKTPAQVALKWLVQQGIAAVTNTARPKHAAEALDLGSFTLSAREMRALSKAR